MYRTHELAFKRIDRFVGERLQRNLYRAHAPLTITAWEVPGEPVPFAAAVTNEFRPFELGREWGKPWGTVWFHVTGQIPSSWSLENGQLETVVDLGFSLASPGFQAEALVWTPDGRIVKAIEPRNNTVPLAAVPGDTVDLYVEAASNPSFTHAADTWTTSPMGRLSTAGTAPLYRLRDLEIAVLDLPVWELVNDIWTLRGLAAELPEESTRRAEIVAALEKAVDAVDPENVSATAQEGKDVLAVVLAKPASASAHKVTAVGHAHIDSAWLWPVRETIRKCARTFSNVLALMDADPEVVFACSSAQQYSWMKQYYPDLFERIRARVIEGRFVPVGGMWVESDTNMPSGESLARQLVEGRQFFIDEFGFEPGEVWLPDSFGYTAALPQLAAASGATSFLTQKLSWNETNVFPHSSFDWEGIDGTRIFTHFPPVDTYNAELSGHELARAERQFHEKGTGVESNSSLVPFGFGDGGGGPTRETMAAARRTRSLEGSPTVTVETPARFFERAKAELPSPAVWTGELYLEFHRGTYTSQARTKLGNRRSEALLHEAELWAATAAIRASAEYPYDELQDAWHLVLLQQFHDILPGSSIGWVHDQAAENYARVGDQLEALVATSLSALGGSASPSSAFNSSPYEVSGIPAFGAGPMMSSGEVASSRDAGGIVIDNGLVRVVIDDSGLISSLIDAASGREVIPEGTRGNLPQLFRDTPTQWDAWDVDKEFRNVGTDLTAADSVELSEAPGTATVRVVRSFGASRFEQSITVSAGSGAVEIVNTVDWHEQKKLLKLGFPVDVHTDSAVSEIQFGHLERPTVTNTSWDSARFETVAHRWVHVSDAAFGVAIANDATYGHDVTRVPVGGATGSRTYSLVRQSLLRAPVFPDPEADQGVHVRSSSIVVGPVASAIEEGYRLRTPLRPAAVPVRPLVASSSPAIVVDTVKLARDRSGDLILRLYEAHGTRARGRLDLDFAHVEVVQTDLLERVVPATAILESGGDGGTLKLELHPFSVVTLRVRR
jgi:alpha-mannosidase